MVLWHLEFYRIDADGKRSGGAKVTDGSASIGEAITQARSMMRNNTFSFGKANLCLIKDQDGALIQEVLPDAQRL